MWHKPWRMCLDTYSVLLFLLFTTDKGDILWCLGDVLCFPWQETFRAGFEGSVKLESARQSCSNVRDSAWWCLKLYSLRAAKDLRVASCWSQELVLSLLPALPLFSTVNGIKAIQSVLKEHRKEEMQYLAMLPKWCWVRPGSVWKLCGRCGGKRAHVLYPHGQHRGTAAGLWFYDSPCILPCWHESSHKERKVCSSWERWSWGLP